jgi:peroxiredoxin family protein
MAEPQPRGEDEPRRGGEPKPPNRISIIVASDKLDKLFPAVTLASTAAVMGWEAELFFTMWGLSALRRGYETSEVSSDYKLHEASLMRTFASGSMPGWREMLAEGRKMGRLRVYACSTTMGMLGIGAEDLSEMVDDVVGAAYFLDRAKDSDINLFIS